jgi:hypothetical protein
MIEASKRVLAVCVLLRVTRVVAVSSGLESSLSVDAAVTSSFAVVFCLFPVFVGAAGCLRLVAVLVT